MVATLDTRSRVTSGTKLKSLPHSSVVPAGREARRGRSRELKKGFLFGGGLSQAYALVNRTVNTEKKEGIVGEVNAGDVEPVATPLGLEVYHVASVIAGVQACDAVGVND